MKLTHEIKRKILIKKEFIGIQKFKPFETDQSKKQALAELISEITAEHSKYVQNISSPEMAMSLELAKFLMKYCLATQPKTLLDLGSGFSSYIFRLYKEKCDNNAIIYSIDDNSEWLKKTKNYIESHHLNTENILSLDELKERHLNTYFDLILLDLNFVEVRQHYITYSIELKKELGTLIIDDVHKVEFLREVKSKTVSQNLSLFDIRKETIDRFGRVAIVVK